MRSRQPQGSGVVAGSSTKRRSRTRDLQQLLEEIGTGAIGDVEELEEQDLRLLRAYCGEGEDLQVLLDRLRDQDREER